MTPSEQMLTELYSRFSRGDMAGVLELCDDSIVFTVPGTTSFSGTHTKATFGQWIGEVMRICGGQFRETPVDIIANDDHGVAILDHWLMRDGKEYTYRTDHIWEIKDGKCTSFLERPGDQDAFNRYWG